MRYVISVLTILGTLAAAGTVASAAEVTRTYTSGSYNFTCIMVGDNEVCGNWNVVSGG